MILIIRIHWSMHSLQELWIQVKLFLQKLKRPGNPVFIVGSSTGKDGIAGAAFASKDITEDSADDLPSVQVGDPFMEKLLLEATMELLNTDAVAGMQDMGAAGITCSTCEMSAGGGVGMEIQLDKVSHSSRQHVALRNLVV